MHSLLNQIQDQQPHQRRVLVEYLDLKEKHQALRAFLGSQKILDLPAMDQNLLFEQFRIMGMYVDVLENRIDRFTAQ